MTSAPTHDGAGIAPDSARNSARFRFVVRFSLLLALLSWHFCARLHHAKHVVGRPHHHYSFNYGVSLSLLMGQGYKNLALTDAAADEPVRQFLDLQRASLSESQLSAFRRTSRPAYRDGKLLMYDQLASSRVLDLRLAAVLWKMFGASWPVLFAFYALVSTGTCLLVFLIARRLGGGYLPGLLAALVFCASPLETFLSGWSIRDTSPLWFACLTFYVLICRVDRSRRLSSNALAALALGICATIGIGWRWDVLILVPFVGLALTAYLWCVRRPWRYVALSLGLFMTGSAFAYTSVIALTQSAAKHQSTMTGFHIAYYGDYNRCNLLGLENNFQVEWGDMQTFFEARRYAYARNPSGELPGFVSLAHAQACRSMYFQLAPYHAYRWVRGFPLVCLRALQGLPDQPGPLPGLDPHRGDVVARGRIPWLAPVHERILDPLLFCLPAFFLLGVMASTVYLRERVLSLALAGFALYFIAILFAVLPMQKNSAMLLLPLSVFGGLGLAVALRLCWPPLWRKVSRDLFWRRTLWAVAGVSLSVAIWQIGCWIARPVSVAARRSLVRRLDELSHAKGLPAPETIRGDRTFLAAAPAQAPHDLCGYRVTVQTGADPGELVCRSARLQQGQGIPVLNWTRHALAPDCEQTFFVSCFQGGRLGDPRPQTYLVHPTGDAKFTECRRFDMSRWLGLPVCLVCMADERTPGSPIIGPAGASNAAGNIRAFADAPEAPHVGWFFSNVRFARKNPPRRRPRPLTHVALRDAVTGYWSLAQCDGRSFSVRDFGWWSPDGKWTDQRVGDFDGDGFIDIIGRHAASGGWWLNSTDGYSTSSRAWSVWEKSLTWQDPLVGDFNGDGLADLAGRAAEGGQWWVTISNGTAATNQLWGAWPTGDWRAVRAGDFDGDGSADIAGLDRQSGKWTVALARNGKFENQSWGTWEQTDSSAAVSIGDFDGDGRDDVAQLTPKRGVCRVGWSTGKSFRIEEFPLPQAEGDNLTASVGDFNGDGLADLLVRNAASRELRVVCFVDQKLTAIPYGHAPDDTKRFLVGDFSGDGRCDALSINAQGKFRVGAATDDGFDFEDWGEATVAAQSTADPVLVRFWETRGRNPLR